MRQKVVKRITGICAIGLAGILAFVAVRDAGLTAQAEETLYGIETLRQQVDERDKPYTILEIVPDIQAAEIGYYIPGYEPALSDRDANSGEWSSWIDGLKELHTKDERVAYMDELEKRLEQFYSAGEFTDTNRMPVTYSEYDEVSEPKNGYTKLDFDVEERYGYFAPYDGDDVQKYQVKFSYVGAYSIIENVTEQYYCAEPTYLTEEMFNSLPDTAELFFYNTTVGSERFESAGIWADLKKTVSGGDAETGGSVSDGDSESGGSVSGNDTEGDNRDADDIPTGPVMDYYLVDFRIWDGQSKPIYPGLYAAASFAENEEGDYAFFDVEQGSGFPVNFTTESIYYKGGFANHEWFRRYVLNMKEGETESFPMKVVTLTASELSRMEEVPYFDMLYINSGVQGGMMSYGDDNDLTDDKVDSLLNHVLAAGRACIVDASVVFAENIVINESLQDTNIFYLCTVFLQKKPADTFSTYFVEGRERPDVDKLLSGLANYREETVDEEGNDIVAGYEDPNFVTEQTYSFYQPHDLMQPEFYTDYYYQNNSWKVRPEAFQIVLDEIVSENLNRAADTSGEYGQLPTDITQATVVRHIMNYQYRRNIQTKKTLKVLDIEPCLWDTTATGTEERLAEDGVLTEAMVKEWASGVETVQITRMTSAEFIGRIEDLNETYDLIYIGTNTFHMNVDENGKTVFNDSSMDGLIYYHTGDMRYGAVELAGQLDTEYRTNDDGTKDLYFYNPVRYGGNDISQDKVNALNSFLNASYPIIVSDDFIIDEEKASDGGEIYIQRSVNSKHIDNSSYLYDFVNQALNEKRTNFFAKKDISSDSELFHFYLNRPKATVHNKANGDVDENGVYYIDQESNGRYVLKYHFSITNEGAASADTRYQCKLFIDVNADGKYSESEKLDDIIITQNGTVVADNNLTAGKEYMLQRNVPDGYKGVLPWKVQVVQTNNPDIRSAASGYTKLRGLQREKLDILQIGRDKILERDWWGGNNEVLFSLEDCIADPDNVFHKLIYGGSIDGIYYKGIYDDFDIDVKYMTISEFEAAFDEDENILTDYNMLILGFSDAYGEFTGTESTGPMGAILDYINSGKAVLFAHDTTSVYNMEQDVNIEGAIKDRELGTMATTNQYKNAYSLNKYIRNLVGMDRYGISVSEALREGVDLHNFSNAAVWDALVESGKDMAYVANTGKTWTSGLTQGYTYYIINAKHDGEGKTYFSEAETGVEGGFENKYLNLRYGTVHFQSLEEREEDKGWEGLSSDNGDIVNPYNGQVKRLMVNKVNSGQITEYPYKLADEFMVAPTHAQYYQLDFTADADQDKQTDLVVWYCLGQRLNLNNEREETVYSISRNDVANNYYIYNKGNITYTGMGHNTKEITVEEAKLFINTMVASYSAGIKDPNISVLSGGDKNAKEINAVYSYYDDSNEFAFNDSGDVIDASRYENEIQRVYFSASDVNFVKGIRKLTVDCYYESTADDAVSIPYNGKYVTVKKLSEDLQVYNADTGKVVKRDELGSGEIYYIEFSKALIDNDTDRFSLYFEAQSTITSDTNPNDIRITGKVYRKLDFTTVQLFDLE